MGTALPRARSYAGWKCMEQLWLKLARLSHSGEKPGSDEPDLLPFGEHLGQMIQRRSHSETALKWGLISWALAGSAAFFDFDNDTYLDMVQTSSTYSPEFYRFKPGVGFDEQK